MLDATTKRRIDTARDILVGKVPDPKSQVEQITIALIYKFMDDIDAGTEEDGGERSFFTGDFAGFGWSKLMDRRLGGHDTLNLYSESITKMSQNPGVPPLFRDIFNNAYLPYRDPETLRSFLRIIDEFSYEDSESLGDAFEYLLSVLDSQGDAGQFRTPRHIIDFIVAVVDPKKNEAVLDPACGTAGFLISSFKHIMAANTGENGQSRLTPQERGALAENFRGYDISPDMVRLSLVNMYLHGFVAPHIYEYDTLTSEDRWNEYADVILANPPFMSPKGGIRPHNRFSVQSKRSEVLFVDYMAEHLSPTGRAGIIVPEGIIFQSQNAHKRLRKMLVEEYLVAVVSLPAGVFQPYSGVKTSVLILDRALAKRTDHIAFFKVDNDGFDLGAQRRPVSRNDLPGVQAELAEYLRRLQEDQAADGFKPALGQIVAKKTIGADGEYNLNGERFRQNTILVSAYPMVAIGEICDLINGRAFKPADWEGPESGGLPIVRIQNLNSSDSEFNHYTGEVKAQHMIEKGELLFSWSGSRGTSFGAHIWNGSTAVLNQHIFKVGIDSTQVIKPYLFHALNNAVTEIEENLHGGVGLVHITKGNLEKIQIPVPPLEVQKEIVGEIDGYQRVIDGARAVVENYRPHIVVDPEWPVVALGDVCEINPETINPASAYPDKTIFYIDISSVENETGRFLGYNEVASTDAPSRARRRIQRGDVLLSTVRPNLKGFTLLNEVEDRAVASTGFAVLRARPPSVEPAFVLTSVCSEQVVNQMVGMMGKGAYPSINQSDVAAIKIALPPLDIQQKLVAEIEAEHALVEANRELIERFEGKIQAAVGRVWGDSGANGPTTGV